jgi:hypothetical protein
LDRGLFGVSTILKTGMGPKNIDSIPHRDWSKP